MIMRRIVFLFYSLMTAVASGWTPPDNPDPQEILSEAERNATAQRYEDALAKHLWFHENALKYQPSIGAVRLSFALSAWARLGTAYPPALAKLCAIRDVTEQRVRETTKSARVFDWFQEFGAINQQLHTEQRTAELFLWLDEQHPDVAKRCFGVAEPALIRGKQYRLCGKYLEPDLAFESMRHMYRYHLLRAQDSRSGNRDEDYAQKMFANRAATLVALLVLNDRKEEANRIVAAAAQEWDNPRFKQQLEAAVRGMVPEPWP